MATSSTKNRGYAELPGSSGSLANRPTTFAGGVRRRDESPDAFRDAQVDAEESDRPMTSNKRIQGYSQKQGPPPRGFGGLNEHYIRQNLKGASPQVIDELAQEARKAGILIDAQGGRHPDTWANRGMTTSRAAAANPYQKTATPTSGLTDAQRRWFNVASRQGSQASEVPSGAAAGSLGSAMGGSGLSLPSRASAANPYTRAGNIANAKAAGEFDEVRAAYNRDNAAQGYSMDEAGNISEDMAQKQAFARSQLALIAEDIAARRDFARGEAPVRFSGPDMNDPNADEMSPGLRRAEKLNPYGTATATYGAPPSVATTRDAMGRTVPLAEFLRTQRAVQATKYGPDAQKAGENYFNPEAIRKEMAGEDQPLGRANAEQFRKIARGGSINTSRRT